MMTPAQRHKERVEQGEVKTDSLCFTCPYKGKGYWRRLWSALLGK